MLKKNYICLAAFLVILPVSNLNGQDTVKIMCYNLENYTPTDTSRNPYFRTILSEIKPDVLVVEEITSQVSVDIFLNNVLKTVDQNYESGQFISSRFYTQYDSTSNAIFYNTAKFTFTANIPVNTSKRDINRFELLNKQTKRPLIFYAVHLDAGNSDSTVRADQVDLLRANSDLLPAGTDFMVLGDFNIYYGGEAAFQKMISQNKPGYFLDPINKIGHWNNNSFYAAVHTQATRDQYNNTYWGGMDDRFDMILVSQSLMNQGGITFINNSYKAYGNDGQHFNKSITDAPANTAVSSAIATALYNASDHLPVYAYFEFSNATVLDENLNLPLNFSLSQNYPNPFNPGTVISYHLPAITYVTLQVFDLLGREVVTLVNEEKPAGNYKINFQAENLSDGVYFYKLTAGEFVQVKKMIVLK